MVQYDRILIRLAVCGIACISVYFLRRLFVSHQHRWLAYTIIILMALALFGGVALLIYAIVTQPELR